MPAQRRSRLARLGALDRALVATLFPLWLLCFGLGVKTQVHGALLPLLGLETPASPAEHPVLTAHHSLAQANFDEAGLRGGDRLLRVGDADLRGAGPWEFSARARAHRGPDGRVTLAFERDGVQRTTSFYVVSARLFLPSLIVSFAWAAVTLLLTFTARPSPLTRAGLLNGMCWALVLSYFGENRLEFTVCWVVVSAAATLLLPLSIRFLFLFPDGVEPAGRWHRLWPWGFSVLGPFFAMTAFGLPEVGWPGSMVTVPLGGAAVLGVVTHNYRRGSPLTRRRIRWFLFGCYCAGLPVLAAVALAALDPRFTVLYYAGIAAVSLVPISLAISVVAYNVYDVDRLISATASYNLLIVLLVGGGLAFVPRIAEAAADSVGVAPEVGRLALSVGLAAVLVPAHRRLRPWIDAMLFLERYEVDRGVARLVRALAACADAQALTQRAGEGLHRLLQPESCVVYARVGESYAPVFALGTAVPAAFEATSALAAALARGRVLALGASGRRPDARGLGPLDRAALDTLGAEVVLPFRLGELLVAFLCLGPKSSGDVYTPTDLSLLDAVARAASAQLRHFDEAEMLAQARAMKEKLRRFVPGAVAEELASGRPLEHGERECSLLFVDIRGYTGYSEGRPAHEIFSSVNQYTLRVSEIIRAEGGTVVEFNGDGLMAVFGAPRALAEKELHAVRAGREIVRRVPETPLGRGESPLAVGVGIATGEIFIGNIQAADRSIWTAIGNHVNLAARLQALTRTVDAAMVVDVATWSRAGAEQAGFAARPGIEIRGRSEPIDVYALPLGGV